MDLDALAWAKWVAFTLYALVCIPYVVTVGWNLPAGRAFCCQFGAVANNSTKHVDADRNKQHKENDPNNGCAALLMHPPFWLEVKNGDANAVEGVVENGRHDGEFTNGDEREFEDVERPGICLRPEISIGSVPNVNHEKGQNSQAREAVGYPAYVAATSAIANAFADGEY